MALAKERIDSLIFSSSGEAGALFHQFPPPPGPDIPSIPSHRSRNPCILPLYRGIQSNPGIRHRAWRRFYARRATELDNILLDYALQAPSLLDSTRFAPASVGNTASASAGGRRASSLQREPYKAP